MRAVPAVGGRCPDVRALRGQRAIGQVPLHRAFSVGLEEAGDTKDGALPAKMEV